MQTQPILLRGGGDLASGVALRLHHAGYPVLIAELPQPLAVRRAVSFCEAVYENTWQVEDITATLVHNLPQAEATLAQRHIPVLIDPHIHTLAALAPPIVIDARLLKTAPEPLPFQPRLHIGLGPGFTAGKDVHALIETQRGHTLGRVYWQGTANTDSRQPEGDPRRVLRAPCTGEMQTLASIGDHVQAGQVVAQVGGQPITAPLQGVVRGLLHSGLHIPLGTKIGDIDPRNQREYCFLVSDKALAIGGAVLEALLSQP